MRWRVWLSEANVRWAGYMHEWRGVGNKGSRERAKQRSGLRLINY
jgi:hypothetical protein